MVLEGQDDPNRPADASSTPSTSATPPNIVNNIDIFDSVSPDVLNLVFSQVQQGGANYVIHNGGPATPFETMAGNTTSSLNPGITGASSNIGLLAQVASFLSSSSSSGPMGNQGTPSLTRPQPYQKRGRGRPTRQEQLIKQLEMLGVPVPAQQLAQQPGGLQLSYQGPQLNSQASPRLSDFLRNLASPMPAPAPTPTPVSNAPSGPTTRAIIHSPGPTDDKCVNCRVEEPHGVLTCQNFFY
ncbi:3-isopropylmalate dehydratase large subunit [Frankliniella fusca]|uniref:3-isopropylmalate dehydratase large subunit n=1 Tax=Frankliniella fusca TaxID=407009 RepID=A0AAE1LID0_9NEOP|nr:3-isopropylmalate dehydratase large subunit [Frankliniella fusca]